MFLFFYEKVKKIMHTHEVKDTDKRFTIDPITMAISSVGNLKTSLKLGDHNSEIFSFEIPKVVEGHDLSLCDNVRIHYINTSATSKTLQSKDIYKVIDIREAEEDTEKLVFTWLVSGNATAYAGSLNFRILFSCTDENGNYTYKKWTDVYKDITVKDGFDNDEEVNSVFTDVLEGLKAHCNSYIDAELLGGVS